jgi:hypothetical protein
MPQIGRNPEITNRPVRVFKFLPVSGGNRLIPQEGDNNPLLEPLIPRIN